MLDSRVATSGALREVLAAFSVVVDDKPLTNLDRRIDLFKAKMAALASYAAVGFGAAAFGTYKLVDAASNANEALNVITQTFKGGEAGIVEWSKTLGKEMSRSEYTLQDSVGKFGSFLSPVFKDSGEDITAMSKQLSELAVDLASFYNTSDEEAIMRLFSGISGETEAVRRLGIDISDKSLEAQHKKLGGKGAYKALSLQEKTVLRFQKILDDTVDKQGDAKRTADQWANSLKALQGRFLTLATDLGKRILPLATDLLHKTNEIVDRFAEWAKGSDELARILRVGVAAAAVLTAQAVGGLLLALNAEKVWAMVTATGAWALEMATIAAAVLLVEDAYVFFTGGHSVIGDMLKEWNGWLDPLSEIQIRLEAIWKTITNFGSFRGIIENLAAGSDFEEQLRAASGGNNVRGAKKGLGGNNFEDPKKVPGAARLPRAPGPLAPGATVAPAPGPWAIGEAPTVVSPPKAATLTRPMLIGPWKAGTPGTYGTSGASAGEAGVPGAKGRPVQAPVTGNTFNVNLHGTRVTAKDAADAMRLMVQQANAGGEGARVE